MHEANDGEFSHAQHLRAEITKRNQSQKNAHYTSALTVAGGNKSYNQA